MTDFEVHNRRDLCRSYFNQAAHEHAPEIRAQIEPKSYLL